MWFLFNFSFEFLIYPCLFLWTSYFLFLLMSTKMSPLLSMWVVCCEVELLLSGDYKVRDGGLVTTTVNVGGLLWSGVVDERRLQGAWWWSCHHYCQCGWSVVKWSCCWVETTRCMMAVLSMSSKLYVLSFIGQAPANTAQNITSMTRLFHWRSVCL